MIREPAVAGQFYPSEPKALISYLKNYIRNAPKESALGAIVPHAGYMYSGGVAGAVYGCLQLTDTFIILGPNHSGLGSPFAIMEKGIWKTPLGEISIDEDLAQLILKETELFNPDPIAHKYEHSIEVQLPFLQYLNPNFTFVPIVLSHTGYNNCEIMGNALANALKKLGKQVLIIASSDMTHYEQHETAKAKDNLAIDQILDLDPAGLYETVHKNNITMCGIIPATVMLVAAQSLGAKKAKLVSYATSGDITGDYNQVVGYAGIIIK